MFAIALCPNPILDRRDVEEVLADVEVLAVAVTLGDALLDKAEAALPAHELDASLPCHGLALPARRSDCHAAEKSDELTPVHEYLLMSTPTSAPTAVLAVSCARAASGHAVAAPHSSVMNERRLRSDMELP